MKFVMLTLMLLVAVFLILLVLVQRGRGGGLAGALGGMGGQSAFGTKAGDVFTRITIVVAAFWIILCAVSVKFLRQGDDDFAPNLGSAAQSVTGTDVSAEPGAEGDASPASAAGSTPSGEGGAAEDSQ